MDTRTDQLAASLEDIRRTPLDEIPVAQAEAVNRDVHDRHCDEEPVGVARFGSVI